MSRLTINSNILSINAQRQFGQHTKSLESTFTRLSSGLRINKSADDAAGLAVSESLKVDTRIANQGVRNLNDGVSLLSIADSALGELSNVVIRLRELASQSANGSLGSKQRASLDQEAQALASEYNRIARSTTFNGRALFDGDFGRLSLAAGGSRDTLIESGLGGAMGDGTFRASQNVNSGSTPWGVTIADFNRDGIQDIANTNYLGNSISILIGNGNGTFLGPISYTSSIGSERDLSIKSMDLNNDGILDLIASNANGHNISVFIGNGDGSFKTTNSYYNGVFGSRSNSITLDDFNNDGIIDVAASLGNYGYASIMLGNSDGSFKTGVGYSTVNMPGFIDTGDFNQDGIRDLVLAGASSENGIRVLLGNGDGTFKTSSSFSGGPESGSAKVADFNGDGIDDVVKTSNDSTLSVFLGNGNGTFKASQTYNLGATAVEVNAKDFNGDGIIDFVATASDSIKILIGNSNGTFQAATTFLTTSGSSSYGLTVGDLNNDGVMDVVTGDLPTNNLSILFGNSNSGVAALQAFSLKNKFSAKSAMDYLEGVQTRIVQQRGFLGGFQSRVDVAVSVLKTTSLNYSEANSRITDADVAEESANLTKIQILQKASSAVLAQANLQPRIALKLLEGK